MSELIPTHTEGASGLTLEELDEDGALREAIYNVYRDSRADFLGKAVVGGTALLAALAEPPPASAARKSNDVPILNFDLTFEYLQASFYTVAERIGTVRKMSDANRRWANIVGAHERGHVKILRAVLGTKAVKSPFFNFRSVVEDKDQFLKTGVALEDLTVAVLAGQADQIDKPSLVTGIFSLLTTEARHAAWARRIAGVQPIGPAIDPPKSIAAAQRMVASTNFIVRRPKVASRRRPRFTG
jgi:hypothetical protein